ncbi:LLM class flavin-dependent oxidoreductase [Candidatus Binatia bacterium]|nr:LLM class flavin-dependent oxidoreductase [Candidatus Binatia bacterium]
MRRNDLAPQRTRFRDARSTAGVRMDQRIAASLPAPPDVSTSQRVAARAEALGYESLWIADVGGPDPFVVAAAAAATKRVRIGTAVIPADTRTAPVIAGAAASCAELAAGRFASVSSRQATIWHETGPASRSAVRSPACARPSRRCARSSPASAPTSMGARRARTATACRCASPSPRSDPRRRADAADARRCHDADGVAVLSRRAGPAAYPGGARAALTARARRLGDRDSSHGPPSCPLRA